ncbi:MAG: amino acid ABC transporter permease [Pseudolabrys sp.]
MSGAIGKKVVHWRGRMLGFLRSCVSSPLNALLTAAVVALALWALPGLVHWLLVDAVWTGTSAKDCVGHDGACWIFLRAHGGQLLYGSYPEGQRWRLVVAAFVGIAAAVAAGSGTRRLGALWIGAILIAGSVAIGVLMTGGILGLPYVPTSQWGGILLTIVIAAWTIVTALPLGLLLALARQSKLPVISAIAGALIDTVRGLPLVGLLFLVIVMFPLFVPRGFETDKLVRALLAFTIFNAANSAEVFRGGLQAIHRSQIEGGYSLGLPGWRVTALIVVPQVISVSIPGLINICIAIAKETTIVLLLGLFDFVGVLQAGIADPDWLMSQSVRTTAYVFAALVFWPICFSLSRFGRAIERRQPMASGASGASLIN